MLKAIAASLLMEQVLAPNFNFRAKRDDDTSDGDPRTIKIKGLREPSTKRVKNIVESDMTELKANILQDPEMVKSLSGVVDTDVINRVLIPKIIMTKYPDLSEEEVEEVREHLVADMVIRHSEISDEIVLCKLAVLLHSFKLVDKFINIEELDIDLIDSINPFQQAFEVLSKNMTPRVLKSIQECIAAFKVNMTDDEAIYLWPKINEFVRVTRRQPSLDALDPQERRLAEALVYLRQVKREQMKNGTK